MNQFKLKRENRSLKPILLIVAVLVLWGGLLAWGAIRRQTQFDLLKPLIIAGAVLLFVVFWLGLLLTRKSRK